jgi:hypothetical protein
MASYELHELLPELATETEDELEGAAPLWRASYPQGESEAEAETEAFFESLAEYAIGGGRAPAGFGRAAAVAATAARTAGVPLAQLGISVDGGTVIEGEFEGAIAGQGMSPAALMEHYGHAAAEAESEAEAEAFLFPLIPLAAKFLAPQIGRMVMRNGPQLLRGVTRAVRTLRRNPRTRPLVRVMPTVVRRTVADLGRQVQSGRPVSSQAATAALARQTRTVLGDPRQCVGAYRTSRRLDRRYHVTVRELR